MHRRSVSNAKQITNYLELHVYKLVPVKLSSKILLPASLVNSLNALVNSLFTSFINLPPSKDCPSHCSECENASECKVCDSGYDLVGTTCYVQCGTGEYNVDADTCDSNLFGSTSFSKLLFE